MIEISKIDKPLVRLILKRVEQIISIRSERTSLQTLQEKRGCYEQHYADEFENLHEIDKFPEKLSIKTDTKHF